MEVDFTPNFFRAARKGPQGFYFGYYLLDRPNDGWCGTTRPLCRTAYFMESENPDEINTRDRSLVEGCEDPGDWAYAWRASINRGGFRAVDFLMNEIVDAG